MNTAIAIGIMIPFVGTLLGASCVFFVRREPTARFCNIINAFAAGVMIAASVWSLLLPAMEHESVSHLGRLAFLPALCGLWLGILFLLLSDTFMERRESSKSLSKLKRGLGDRTMLFFSVTLHNIPEGMAVGVVYAVYAISPSAEALLAALVLSIGIAVQNFPEGAIVSIPLRDKSRGRTSAFLWGAFSGIVEPLSALFTLFAVSAIIQILPFLLGFAAGAMIFAVVRELMPSVSQGKDIYYGVLSFGAGFSFMMVLDVVFA